MPIDPGHNEFSKISSDFAVKETLEFTDAG